MTHAYVKHIPRMCGVPPVGRGRAGGLAAIFAVALLGLAVGGCSHVNHALSPVDLPLERRAHNATRATLQADFSHLDASELAPPVQPATAATGTTTPVPIVHDADGFFVGVAISGGGSRSANFSAACFFELQQAGVLQHVDYISTVSGGSLTGALYCVSTDDEWNPRTVQDRLTHSFATDLIVSTFLPWNLLAVNLTDLDRSDLLAQSFRKHLFSRNGRELTYADLRSDRPRLLINATDLQSGRRFVFSNEAFDEINSDLSKYPLSYAVAASSAVPIVMHQVTLRDYSTSFKQYRHLIDGGVADNLGVQTLAEAYEAHIRQARENGLPTPYPRGAVLIVIDAATNSVTKVAHRSDTGLLDTLAAGSGVATKNLLNRTSSATMADMIFKYAPDDVPVQRLREHVRTLQDTGYLQLTDRNGSQIRVVHLALFRVGEMRDVPFEGFGEALNSIATYFNISDTEAYHLYQAAKLLVNRKFGSEFEKIASDLNNTAR